MTEQRATPVEWARWYDLRQWSDLAKATHLRDGLICRMCGTICVGTAGSATSAVCDHITPHRGSWSLFTDPTNLQTLCKACHDGPKRSIERRGYDDRRTETGWPIGEWTPKRRA